MKILVNIINSLIGLLGLVLSSIFSILPNSPFRAYITASQEVTGLFAYINYFIPIDIFILILEAWIPCVLVYKGVSTVLRIINVVK